MAAARLNEGPLRMVVEGTALSIERSEQEGSMLITAPQQEPCVLRADRHYSWLGDYLARLEGKEARGEYYAWLRIDARQVRQMNDRR